MLKLCSADSYQPEVQSAVCRIQMPTAFQCFVKKIYNITVILLTDKQTEANTLTSFDDACFLCKLSFLLAFCWSAIILRRTDTSLKGVCYLSPPNGLGEVSFDCFHNVDGLSEHVLVSTEAVSWRYRVHALPIYHLHYTAHVRTNENLVAISAYSITWWRHKHPIWEIYCVAMLSYSGNEY